MNGTNTTFHDNSTMLSIFNNNLNKYPIGAAVFTGVWIGLFWVLMFLIIAVAYGHRAYLLLFCYRCGNERTDMKKAKNQFWLHLLYNFLLVFGCFKIFTFSWLTSNVATSALRIQHMSYLVVDVMLYDFALIILLQVMLIVAGSAAFKSYQKHMVTVARTLMILCALGAISYAIFLLVALNVYADNQYLFSTMLYSGIVPLLFATKLVIVALVLISSAFILISISRNSTQMSDASKMLAVRLIMSMGLIVLSSVLVIICVSLLVAVYDYAVFFMVAALSVPDAIIFLAMIVIFWPSKFSISSLKNFSIKDLSIESMSGDETSAACTPIPIKTPTQMFENKERAVSPGERSPQSFEAVETVVEVEDLQ